LTTIHSAEKPMQFDDKVFNILAYGQRHHYTRTLNRHRCSRLVHRIRDFLAANGAIIERQMSGHGGESVGL